MADISSYFPSIPGKWVKYLAQIGLTAKGILYCLFGILMFMAAFELGSSINNIGRKKVFLFLEEMIIGRVLLGLEVIGLACYCIWKLIQAIKDTELKGTNIKGIINRLRYATNGASYGMLTLFAAQLVFETDRDNGSSSLRKTITTAMLQNPWGYWLVILAAITIALGGAYYVYQGLTGSYQQKIKEVFLKDNAERIMIKAGKAGYAARGIVWIIVGYLTLRAALNVRRGGIQNAFQFLESSFYGSYLLGGVAVGLICYSLFVFMQAKFQISR
ncbi:DUF1206 domain-containing protein [Rhodocytophaga aerolata]|uniref:DUF1206 domain-containing protein n=1 Tax=Rhodocytophaga aerolata TaxID=455078 RepID=A0ABT8RF00_9BACT|nr:DUF1206 domain-containing protein [Rhodocytophaga aerolata]MDO1450680.1 DUF1206 domain-containing protein [Rhodocytophaga aerolata]